MPDFGSHSPTASGPPPKGYPGRVESARNRAHKQIRQLKLLEIAQRCVEDSEQNFVSPYAYAEMVVGVARYIDKESKKVL